MRAYGCVIGVFCATIATDGQNIDIVAKKSHWFVIRLTPPPSCHTSTTCFPGAANTPLPAPRTISVESPRRLIDAQLTSD